MFTAEYFASKLGPYKRVLQIALPAIVAADTLHSCFVVTQLAQKRFKEFEEESKAELRRETVTILQRITTTCQAKNADFWPSSVTNAVLGKHGAISSSTRDSSLTSAQPNSHLNSRPPEKKFRPSVLDALFTPAPTISSTYENSSVGEEEKVEETDASSHQSSNLASSRILQPYDFVIHSAPAAAFSSKENDCTSCPTRTQIIYITWSDVVRLIMQSMQQAIHFLAVSTTDATNDSPLLQDLIKNRRVLQESSLRKIDDVREWCRGNFLWPQIKWQRRSVMRYSIKILPMTFPIKETWHRSKCSTGGLENDLTKLV